MYQCLKRTVVECTYYASTPSTIHAYRTCTAQHNTAQHSTAQKQSTAQQHPRACAEHAKVPSSVGAACALAAWWCQYHSIGLLPEFTVSAAARCWNVLWSLRFARARTRWRQTTHMGAHARSHAHTQARKRVDTHKHSPAKLAYALAYRMSNGRRVFRVLERSVIIAGRR